MSLYRSCMPERTGPKRRRRQSSDRPGFCPSPPPREPATPDNSDDGSQRTRRVKISPDCYLETPRLEGCVRASTYRLVNLKDVQRRVKVRVELVYEHVEARDLFRHGVRHLDRPFGIQCGDMKEQQDNSCTTTLVATFSLMALILILISSISRLSWFLTNSSRSIWYSRSSSAATLHCHDNIN